MGQLVRIFICVFTLGVSLYLYVDKLNLHTELKLQIPAIMKEVDSIQKQSIHLAYEIEQFKNPMHLIQLAKRPEFTHLKFPYEQDVWLVPSGLAQQVSLDSQEAPEGISRSFKFPVLLGTK